MSEAPKKAGLDAESNLDKWRSRVDIIWKVISALAALSIPVVGAIVAGNYQSKTTAITVLSQREKSESELRATMFSNLIGPLVGLPKGGDKSAISGEGSKKASEELRRERILVELLTLNFHESFELKPLLEHIYDKLPEEKDKESLRSIARRVIDRQIAELLKDEGKSTKTVGYADSNSETQRTKTLIFKWPCPKGNILKSCSDKDEAFIGCDTICIHSPDGRYTVAIGAEGGNPKPDFKNWKFTINMNLSVGKGTFIPLGKPFTITPFDFPFTDNTMLDIDHRFAIVIDNVYEFSEGEKELTLKLIWFPEGFISPRERPINYSELRKTLDLDKR